MLRLLIVCVCVIAVSGVTPQRSDSFPDTGGNSSLRRLKRGGAALIRDSSLRRLKRGGAALIQALLAGARLISQSKHNVIVERTFIKSGGSAQAKKDYQLLAPKEVLNNKIVSTGYVGRSYVIYNKQGVTPQLRIHDYVKRNDGTFDFLVDLVKYSCTYEPDRRKKYFWTCAPSEDSDHPAFRHSLIKVFIRRILESQRCKVS